MTNIDLFAGGGGLAIGLHAAGFSPVRLYEKDTIACATLRHNINSSKTSLTGEVYEDNVENINWVDFHAPVRLIAAGTPCQPFSLGGKHRAAEDERNLFPELLRAVRELQPAAVLVENVRGLLREDFRPFLEYILRQLECPSVNPRHNENWLEHDTRIRRHQCSVGYQPEYQVAWRLIDAADFGVPQNRLRMFIVATRSDLPLYKFPRATHSRSALIRIQGSGEYWETRGLRRSRRMTILRKDRDDAQTSLTPWATVRDAISDLRPPAASEKQAWMNHWVIPGARVYAGHSGSTLDWPSKTIKAGVHGVPGGENILVESSGSVRYFTLRELARLQTFPDEHFFSGPRISVTRQLGNAVPCVLASAIARPLYELLEKHIHVGRGIYAAAGIARV